MEITEPAPNLPVSDPPSDLPGLSSENPLASPQPLRYQNGILWLSSEKFTQKPVWESWPTQSSKQMLRLDLPGISQADALALKALFEQATASFLTKSLNTPSEKAIPVHSILFLQMKPASGLTRDSEKNSSDNGSDKQTLRVVMEIEKETEAENLKPRILFIPGQAVGINLKPALNAHILQEDPIKSAQDISPLPIVPTPAIAALALDTTGEGPIQPNAVGATSEETKNDAPLHELEKLRQSNEALQEENTRLKARLAQSVSLSGSTSPQASTDMFLELQKNIQEAEAARQALQEQVAQLKLENEKLRQSQEKIGLNLSKAPEPLKTDKSDKTQAPKNDINYQLLMIQQNPQQNTMNAGQEATLEEEIKLYPDHWQAYLTLARHYQQKGDWSSTERVLNNMLLVDPKNQDALAQLTDLYLRQHKPLQAQDTLDRLFKIYADAASMPGFVNDLQARLSLIKQ